jgi:Ca-activated chloride channel homolog
MQSKETFSDPSNVEPWELTAYALHELDEADRVRVERYLEQHPEACGQMLELKHVANVVRQQLSGVVGGMALEPDRAQKLFEQMIQEGATPGSPAVRLETSGDGSVEGGASRRWRRGRGIVLALAGLAATGLAMFVLRKELSDWKEIAWGGNGSPDMVAGTREVDSIDRDVQPSTFEGAEVTASEPEFGIGSALGAGSAIGTGPMLGSDPMSVSAAASAPAGESSLAVQVEEMKEGRFEVGGTVLSDLGAAGTQREDSAESEYQSALKQESVAGLKRRETELGQEGVNLGNQLDGLSSLSESVVESKDFASEGESLGRGMSDSETRTASASPAEPYGLSSAAAGKEIKGISGGSDSLRGLERASAESKRLGESRVGGGGVRGRGGVAMPATQNLGGPATRNAQLSLPQMKQTLHEGGALNPTTTVLDGEAESDRARFGDFPEELRNNVPSRRKGPGVAGVRYEVSIETPFTKISTDTPATCLSTFSIDVDTASYSKLRQSVLEHNTLPVPGALRIEELINYFEYDYPGPKDSAPFAAHLRMAVCPWNPEHQLVRVAVQAKKVDEENRPASNLVFLIDVSGSMAAANKLPLVKRTLMLLTQQLREHDRVAIVVYAGAAGCVLPSTLGSNKDQILAAIDELQSGGSTNGGQGIELAYRIAKENFVAGGVNRVILCTDGDFNVGVTGTDQLVAMMQENAKSNVFLTCLGYGAGNYNDSMMEQISNQGNGTYGMIDNELEARRVMVEQLSGTLMTVAKDVKLQIEFNPSRVSSYRLIGYENRRLANEDFANDRKDAGEIGAGHRVTALYEIVPVGSEGVIPGQPKLRYGSVQEPESASKSVAVAPKDAAYASEWLHLSIRSKMPEATESTLQEFVLHDMQEDAYVNEQSDMDWAVSLAEFGLLLRQSKLAPGIDWERMLSRAQECIGNDATRRECLAIMQRAKQLAGR